MRQILALGLLLVNHALNIEKIIKMSFVIVMIGEQLSKVMWIWTMSVSYVHSCTDS